jgi:hypothetical protein
MGRLRKSQILAVGTVISLCLMVTGCSSFIEEVEQIPAPDITKAISEIKIVATQYHLTGDLQIAGPIKAPEISLVPWVICLRSPSETRFTVAIFYKANTLVSSREALIVDHCDSQTYRPIAK